MNQNVISTIDSFMIPGDTNTKSAFKSFHGLVDARPDALDTCGVVLMDKGLQFPIVIVVLTKQHFPYLDAWLALGFHG